MRAIMFFEIRPLGTEVVDKRLPGMGDSKKFANVDPIKDPIPVVPTCHYMMGGIPTNYSGEVLSHDGSIVEGLFANESVHVHQFTVLIALVRIL